MQKLATLISSKLEESELIDEADKELYEYVIGYIAGLIVFSGITLIVSMLMGIFRSTLIFLIFFTALRTRSGGFHFSQRWLCNLVSAITSLISLILLKFFPFTRISWMIIGIICIFTFVILLAICPVDTANHRLDNTEKKAFRSISLKIFAVEASTLCAFAILGYALFVEAALIAFILTDLLLICGFLQNQFAN